MRQKFFIPGADKPDEYKIDVSDCKDNIQRVAREEGLTIGVEESSLIVDVVCNKRNVFLTGSAGTGKSTTIKLLKKIMHYFRVPFGVTAPSGVAASILSGRTIHSWLGIGLGPPYEHNKDARDYSPMTLDMVFDATAKEKTNNLYRYRPGKIKTLKSTEVLIVDEISMMPGRSLLDFVDYYLRKVRFDERPFGGMTVVFVGDFLQLPPVSKSKMYEGKSDWAFQSEAWQSAKPVVYMLTKVHRQKDKQFADCLETIRKGEPLSASQMGLLGQCYRPSLTEEEKLRKTYIMPTNKMCDERNDQALATLRGELIEVPCKFVIRDEFAYQGDTTRVEKELKRATKHKDTLFLKKGCEVLMTINDVEQGFFNGTRARVLDILSGSDGKAHTIIVYTKLDIPYEKALAIFHGEQTADLDSEENCLGVCRVGTVATTRGNFEPSEEMIDPVTPEEKAKYGEDPMPKWPRMLQFPVIPAYAVTIHSAQGLSLNEAIVNTDNSFAYGQVYVALSRVKSLAGLTLLHNELINDVDPEAKAYHEEVERQALGRPPCPV